MNNFPTKNFRLIVSFIFLFLQLSCSKDTDFLTAVILPDSTKSLLEIRVIAAKNESVVIDVTAEGVNGELTNVTEPDNGTANINPDNTITYTPDTDAEGTDEFEFTTNISNPDNTTSTETGSIMVTIKPPTDSNGINFSKYGVVGDGVKDDTSALQRALDAESNLIATANAVFKVSARLDIDLRSNQTIKDSDLIFSNRADNGPLRPNSVSRAWEIISNPRRC